MLKSILLITFIFGFSISFAQSSSCIGFYGNKFNRTTVLKVDDKALVIEKIGKNKKGEVFSVDIKLSGEILPGESAVKLSNILKKIEDRDVLASDVVLKISGELTLNGKGDFFGIEVDINTNKNIFTINIEQNIDKIDTDQTFVSLLTGSTDTSRILVNLGGEVKRMDATGKFEKQRCKN